MSIVSSNLPLFNDDEYAEQAKAPKRRPYGLRYDTGKPCTRCHKIKPVSEFSKRYTHRYTSWCKECLCKRKKEKYRDNHNGAKERASAWSRMNMYGLDSDTYQMMVFQQGSVCAVCGEPQRARHTKLLCVDHNHETGQIRELLCHTCNVLLGYVEKDRSRVKKLVEYLKKHDT